MMPYDCRRCAQATELGLALPRVGFYTTPAFLALWNTNDSNQHRVTANQTLLVALGASLTPANADRSAVGGRPGRQPRRRRHRVLRLPQDAGSAAPVLGHPARLQRSQRFPGARRRRPGGQSAPRDHGRRLRVRQHQHHRPQHDRRWARCCEQVVDSSDPAQPVSRFALAVAQKLCFFANSSQCLESDPEFRRVAQAFEQSGFSFPALLQGADVVAAGDRRHDRPRPRPPTGFTISIARRDQLCAALSNRLGKPDLCSLAVPHAVDRPRRRR